MSLGKVKAFLTLLMAVGAATYFGGGGALASFSAETSNEGSTIASGTLTMSNTVNTNTACFSNASATDNNVNAGCDALFHLTSIAPGIYGGTAEVSIENTGSIDASKLWIWAPSVTPNLTTALTSGNSVSSLAVSSLSAPVYNGQSVVVKNGSNSQTFYANANEAANATSISVVPQNANFSYPATTATTVDVADCYDQLTTGGTNTATAGNNLNFVTTTGNPLCNGLHLYVQEITGMTPGTPSTKNYCWVGATEPGAGMCAAPISVTLSATGALTSGNSVSTLNVTALNGNVAAPDIVVVSDGTHSQNFTVSANAYVGATSISVTPVNANANYATGATVTAAPLSVDANGALSKIDGDILASHTLAGYDSVHDFLNGPAELPQVQTNGTLYSAPSSLPDLPHGTTRTFLVGVVLASPLGSTQNNLQGLQSTFGLTWHIDQ